jgi:DNA-binding response OmpR family regulator
MTQVKLLLVEDEKPIRDGLKDRLEREGFRVTDAATLADAMRALDGSPDLVILDRRLPDGEGLLVLRELRARGRNTPVIVLSARGMPEDRVEGLEGGADDYVTKPFHLRELVARVHAVLKRTEEPGPARVAFGDCEMDLGARTLRRRGREVTVTRMEFELLLYLARNPGRAVTRTELLDRVWGYDRYPTTRTVDFHVLSLRKKVDPRHIVTIHGVGYRFDP